MTEIFSPEINWLNSLIEEHEYETTITETYDGDEQRQSLMDIPHRRLTYTISALNENEAGRLEGLIRKVQGEPCYVPYWRGARYLKSPVAFSPGAKSRVYIDDVSTAGFEIGNWLILFVDERQVAVSQIYSILSDSILTEIDLWNSTGPWPIGRTKVVPAFLGQLAPEVSPDYAAKFAKVVQVVFDLHPQVREMSADCNWQFLEAVLNPLHIAWSIDPTGGPTGGPALKGVVPPNSRDVHLVDFSAMAYITLAGLMESDVIVSHPYSMEAKVKTDWNIAGVSSLDGKPGIALGAGVGRVVGTGGPSATAAAFNAWETLNTVASQTAPGGILSPGLFMSLGTSDTVPHTFWFADVIIRDEDGNIIHSCLPAIENTDPANTPIFAPLDALHRPGQSLQVITRKVEQLHSPAGVFSARARADDPLTSHPLSLVFLNQDEWFAFRTFHDLVRGAFEPFWVPSYQQDLTPIGVIGPTDVDIDIRDVGYTEYDFPSFNRRQIAFVMPDGSFLKRSITNAVNNGDGTETITINNKLDISFSQNNANGICFLWYCRFADDVARTDWMNSDMATMDIVAVELRDPPDGGSGQSSDGFLLDAP